MASEEHPHPEGNSRRLGPPAAATGFLGVVVVSMFAMAPGLAQTLTIAAVLALDVPLMLWRGSLFRRAACPADVPMRWHQFVFFRGTTAGFSVIDGDRGPHAGLIHVGSWFLGAVFVVGVLWLTDGARPPRWLPTRRAPSRSGPVSS